MVLLNCSREENSLCNTSSADTRFRATVSLKIVPGIILLVVRISFNTNGSFGFIRITYVERNILTFFLLLIVEFVEQFNCP